MQSFEDTIKTATATPSRQGKTAASNGLQADACAGLLLETVPRIMRIVRAGISNMEPPGLTIPQFRTLLFLQGHGGTSLSVTADFLGLTLPSTSKLVDQLVRRGLVDRGDAEDDRRRMNLRITLTGDALLQSAQKLVRVQLAGMLDRFKPTELASLKGTLELLQDGLTLLAEDGPACGNHVGHHRPAAQRAEKPNGAA